MSHFTFLDSVPSQPLDSDAAGSTSEPNGKAAVVAMRCLGHDVCHVCRASPHTGPCPPAGLETSQTHTGSTLCSCLGGSEEPSGSFPHRLPNPQPSCLPGVPAECPSDAAQE